MTALTAVYDAKRKDGGLIGYPVAAGAKVYKGALVCVSTGTGYAQTGADAASLLFVGVAYDTADNTGGAGGAKTVRVQKSGEYLYNAPTAAQTDVGKPALIVDDNTVKTAATTNNVPAGVVVGYVDSGHLLVRIDGKVN